MAETGAWEISSEEPYEGWVASTISSLSAFIDLQVNPRHHYVDLQEIADRPGGTTLYVVRMNSEHHSLLTLQEDVRERDECALRADRSMFIAIKTVPIMPAGGVKLGEVLQELTAIRGIQSVDILPLDALYVDPLKDTLWIWMELMTRTMASFITLGSGGLVLADRVIAGCVKDVT
ncbi:hypothetical protein B0H14DRAFT_2340663 [Mycena olivaceomarginata]|nr:hypothetical protein B0H14DRAFT_2340663 [Mycena olivaceomarginata]